MKSHTRTHVRLTLSGRNNQDVPRTVYAQAEGRDEQEIGEVRPNAGTWIACDMNGGNHGDMWLTDWYAAEALLRGQKIVAL